MKSMKCLSEHEVTVPFPCPGLLACTESYNLAGDGFSVGFYSTNAKGHHPLGVS